MKGSSNSAGNPISYLSSRNTVAAPTTYTELNRGTGPILATPELVSLYWGGFAQSEIDGMQTYLSGFASYLSGQSAPAGQEPDVRQYGVMGATVGVHYVQSTTPATAVSDADLQQQIVTLQNQGLLPAFSNGRIFLIFTKGISFSIILGGGSYGQTWCGFHDQWSDGEYYALCPYPLPGCISGDAISSWQSITSHEIMEAATDPKPFTGWTPEGGDQCAWQEVALSFGTMQKFADNQQQTCSVWTEETSMLQVVAADLDDGRIQMWLIGQDGTVQSRWKQTTDPSSGWTAWSSFAVPSAVQVLAVGRLSDGRLQLWVVSAGQLWSQWKQTTDPSSGWTAWSSFATPPTGAATIAVASLSDGRLQLFIIDATGQMWSTWKSSTDSNSPWTPLSPF